MSGPGEVRRGLFALVGAFGIWGFLPLYLRPLHAVAPLQITAHRLVWCSLFALGWLAARGESRSVADALRMPATRRRLVTSATLIAVNWLTYVWAIGNGHVVDSSLGYFINPLVNVLLGVVVLGERLNRVQWSAVGLAAVGVLYLTLLAGTPPWIALVLAFSFGTYGLIRKTVSVDALAGLATETILIAPFGAVYIAVMIAEGRSALCLDAPLVDALLLGGGPVTAIPLVLFALGARRVPYSTVGLLQYLGPTLQLLLGVFVFGETFGPGRAVGFVFIWTALAVYAADGLRRRRLWGATADP